MSEKQIYSKDDLVRMSRWGGVEQSQVAEIVGRAGMLKPDAEGLRPVPLFELRPDQPQVGSFTRSEIDGLLNFPAKAKEIKSLAEELRASQLDAILADAKLRFVDKTIGVRGIVCSTEGEVVLKNRWGAESMILPVEKIFQAGKEKPQEAKVNVASGTISFPKVSAQFLVESFLKFYYQMRGSSAAKRKLRPAVVVYDMDKLEYAAESEMESYAHHLVPEEGAKAILAIYLVNPGLLLPKDGK